MLRCCTYLRISRDEQDNGVALERMLFEAQRAAKALGGDLPPEMIFLDRMSGRRDDRPDFTSIWGLIESRAVDVVIFYRIDRLGRDAELLLKLSKLFEKTGVGAYVCEHNKILDWKNLRDWELWARSSIEAEKESRTISDRLRKAHEFNQHKQQAAFVCPFGYQRGANRKYEPNLDEWDKARRIINIIEEEQGIIKRAIRRIDSEMGVQWSTRGLQYWLRNPVLRGHTPYGKKGQKQSDRQMFFNTHSGLLEDGSYCKDADYRLLTEERYQAIEQLLKDRSFLRGSNALKQPYPLTGLTECICGAGCTVLKTNSGHRQYLYLRCRAGDERWLHTPKHTGRIFSYYQVEKTVITYLASCAETLIEAVLETSEETPLSPEVLRKMANIEYLESGIRQFGDPTGEQANAIARLKMELAGMNAPRGTELESERLRQMFKQLSDIEVWTKASNAELRSKFITFISKIRIDFDSREIFISLNPLLRL